MRGNRIGVQRLKKSKANENPLIVMGDAGDMVGIVKFLGDNASEDLKVGMKVYYGNKKQQVKIQGLDIEVMEDDNIFAIAEDLDGQTQI